MFMSPLMWMLRSDCRGRRAWRDSIASGGANTERGCYNKGSRRRRGCAQHRLAYLLRCGIAATDRDMIQAAHPHDSTASYGPAPASGRRHGGQQGHCVAVEYLPIGRDNEEDMNKRCSMRVLGGTNKCFDAQPWVHNGGYHSCGRASLQ